MARIALTGGAGFVGGALLEMLLARGDTVAALARTPSKLQPQPGLDIVQGDLDDLAALKSIATGAAGFIHCAGLTHALDYSGFARANVHGAANAARAAAAAGARFVHLSSMAARRPELSDYARSKAESETAVADASGGDWISLRLPALYGPGDSATLPYFKLVKRGLAPEPAARHAPRASILFVDDAARAILAALDEAPTGRIYEVGDERDDGHSWGEIGAALGSAFGRMPRALRAPRPCLMAYAGAAQAFARVTRRPVMVTPGKIREFFHDDWVAHDPLLSDATSWRPRTPLAEGFAKTVRWYQERNLL